MHAHAYRSCSAVKRQPGIGQAALLQQSCLRQSWWGGDIGSADWRESEEVGI